MCTQTKALAGINRTTVVHRESSALMTPELITEELSIPSGGLDELKTVDVRAVLITFYTISNPDKSYYPFQNDLKNIPNKVTSNMEADFKQELQKKQAYPSFNLTYLPVDVLNRKITHYCKSSRFTLPFTFFPGLSLVHHSNFPLL